VIGWTSAVGAAVVALSAVSAAPAVTLEGTVTTVIDGDTIRVNVRGFETPVRLVGVDTPETRKPGTPVQCWGPQATARTRHLLPVGQSVRLVTDPTQDTRDRYGRLLAYVYRRDQRTSVNYRLVLAGSAKVYVYRPRGPFRHIRSFRRAQARARTGALGLWGAPCFGDTTKPSPGDRPVMDQPREPEGGTRGCDPNYTGACVPVGPPDVDCEDLGRPVRVVGDDPHRLDGDRDGNGCEAYA